LGTPAECPAEYLTPGIGELERHVVAGYPIRPVIPDAVSERTELSEARLQGLAPLVGTDQGPGPRGQSWSVGAGSVPTGEDRAVRAAKAATTEYRALQATRS